VLDSLPISFDRPWYLVLLLALPILWWAERGSLVAIPASRRKLSRVLRHIIVIAVILALAGLQIVRTSNDLTVLYAIDRSDSTRDRLDDLLGDLDVASAGMTRTDKAGLIVFGSDAFVEASPESKPAFGKLETLTDPGNTNLAAAIRLALGVFPEDSQKRLVLITDGNETLGNALEAASTAAANGIPIDVLTVERKLPEEVLVEEAVLPPTINRDEPFDLRLALRSTTGGPAKLRLFRNGAPVGTRDVELDPGKNIFTFTLTEKEEGFHTYQAYVESLYDTMRENNTGAAVMRVFGKPRLLVVGGQGDREFLARAMSGQNWEVEEADTVPWRRAQFENYDGIVLANHSADNLSDQQLQMLHDYVRDQAGGLIMTGGEHSFGLGMYARTPVEEALPVNLELSSKRHFPSLTMGLVIDKSGSMSATTGGRTKLELAAQACMEAVQIMTPRDQVLVIAFDGAPTEVVPLQVIGDKRVALSNDIASIAPGGGTDLYPAFKKAVERLTETQSQLKHLVLLTDGMTNPGNFVLLAQQALAANITVSTVAVGPDADTQLLITIAGLGGGRFYHALDPYSIPKIFARETYLAQRAYIIEEPFIPAVYQENQIIQGLDSFPEVRGYVVTESKDRTEMLLLSHKGDPLLAVWRFGLGKSLAFTSDVKARWLQSWIGWEGFNTFWSQAARWTMRSQRPSDLHPTLTVSEGRGHLVVDAVDDANRFINFLNLRARVSLPEGSREPSLDVTLSQTGPGRYEGTFDARDTGAYIGRVYGAEEQGIMPATAGKVIAYPPEYRHLDPNLLLLNQIVAKTGGRLNPPLAELYRREARTARQRYDIFLWLLMGAVVLLPFDIAVRRIYLDDEQIAAIRTSLNRLNPFAARRANVDEKAQAATMAALRRTKQDALKRRFGRGQAAPESAPIAGAAEAPPDIGEQPSSEAVQTARATGEAAFASSTTVAPGASAATVANQPPATGEPSPSGLGTLDRLRRAKAGDAVGPLGGPPPSPVAGDKPRVFMAPPTGTPSAPAPSAAPEDPADANLSPTERLLRARQRALDDRGKKK